MRAILYGRVSQDVQRDNFSIPTQIAACARHAREHGYSIVGEQHVDAETGRDAAPGPGTVPAYVDDHSGTELLRPSVLTMLEYLQGPGADAVIVLSLDRLARDPYIRQTLEREIEATGARVIYVQGNYSDTPEGEIHKDLDGAFAKWENLKRTERSLRGKIGKAQRGLFVTGTPPYGYALDKTAQGGLVINEDTAALVRRMFTMYAEGECTLRGIATKLNKTGVPSPRGAKWTNTAVHDILRNKTYTGQYFYNKTATIMVGDGIVKAKRQKQLERGPEEWIPIAVTPIIDGVIFERVQRRLDFNREAFRKQANRFYLLSGMVFCEACGRRYTAQTEPARQGRVEARQYRHRRANGDCGNHLVNARKLEAPVWESIVKRLLDPAELIAGREDSLAAQREKLILARAHLETLRRDIAKLDKRKANYRKMYADSDMTRTEYLKDCAEVDRERGDLAAQAEKIEKELAAMPSEGDMAELQKFAEDIRAYFGEGDLPDTERRAILEKMHVKVTINADHTKAQVEGIFKPFDFCLLSKPC